MRRRYHSILLGAVIGLMAGMNLTTAGEPADRLYPEDYPFYSGDFRPRAALRSTARLSNRKFRVVSYNIHWSENLPGVIRDLQLPSLRDADVILLQEVAGTVDGDNTAREIAQALGVNYVYSPGCVIFGKNYGNAILSRHRLRGFEKVNLPFSELNVQRTALRALVDIAGEALEVYSVHFSVRFADSIGRERSRVAQAREILMDARTRDFPTVIAGDFNKFNPWSWWHIERSFHAFGYRIAHGDIGWTFRDFRIPLDFGFSDGRIRPTGQGNEYQARGSDHIPIWMDFEWL